MDLYELRDEFDRTGTLMCFNGPFYHSIIEEFGKAIRSYLTADNIAQEALMDVFAVYIELAQNIRNYHTLRGACGLEAASSIITIGRNGKGYKVSSGNVVLNSDLDALCGRVDGLNAMTGDELKSEYRRQRRREVPPEALGAGLGLLEIARRSSDDMTYVVRELDAGRKFFSLTVYL